MAGLAQEPADSRDLKALLAPYPSEAMMWPVSARVGSVKDNDPSLRHAHGAITQG